MGVGEAGRARVGDFPRPRLVASRCLGFEHCRYDGSVISAPHVQALAGEVKFLTVCPEMAIGLP
ncbi:MAG TPA: DUF523 domain-containing protein, partial [Candidatus Acetothermia bacterium]|nr:DUF523 domain-containing protein [Candidatus Acetothermia bacterium]